MRSPTKVKALVAVGVAAALALTACSSSNDTPNTSSNAGGSDAAAGSSAGGSSAAGSDTAASDTGSGSAPASSGSGAAASSGGDTAGASGAQGSGTPAEPGKADANAKGTLNIFMYGKPNGDFGPLAPASGPDQQVISLIYDELLQRTPKGELEPYMATALPTSPDGKTFTFKMKPNLKWSDGQPLTSADVVFSFTRAADTRTSSGPAPNFATISGLKDYIDGKTKTISGITAPDATTIVVKQDAPNLNLPAQIGVLPIFPEHVLKDHPLKDMNLDKWFRNPTVTSGPFKFVEYKTDQYAHVTANPYFRENVGVKDIYVKPETVDVATQQLSTGEMDIVQISAPDIETVKGFGNTQVLENPSTGGVKMDWNQSQARFKDPKVKQAFLYAVDRAGLIASALQGHGEARNSIFAPKWSGDVPNKYEYNPDKAKQLLQEANFDFNKPVDISWSQGGNYDRDAAVQVIAENLKAIGVKVTTTPREGPWFADEAFKKHNYDMFVAGMGDYGVNPAGAGPVTNCDQWVPKGPNTGMYCDKDMDAAMAKALVATTVDQQKELYHAAAQIENANPSMGWLYSLNWVFGVSKATGNFQVLDSANWFEPWKWTKSS